jgi:hypothetical protein
MGAWDAPPPSGGFFGCIGQAAGVILLMTGGLCSFVQLSRGRFGFAAFVGLCMVALGLAMMRAR